MATNPLYRDEFYFFSSMYDDTLITDFYRHISAETYKRSIQYQNNMIGRKRNQHGDIFYVESLNNFSIDEKYNTTVGLPLGSRTLKIDNMILPIYHKKKFISEYGLKYQIIPLTDFYKRNDIFDKVITLQIGKYRILSACLIQNLDKSITLAIPNSSTTGIPSTSFDKIITEYSSNDEAVWLFSDEITQMYYVDTSVSASISSAPNNGYYEVKVPITSAINNIGTRVNHEYSNSWDCLISCNSIKYGKRILVSSPCSFKSTVKNDLVFSVNEKFINYIKGNSINFNIYFIHRPNRKHILLYTYNDSSSPILNLDYTYNPAGNINIEVFEIDSSVMCKGRKLYDPAFKQIYFPNIFDFSSLNVNKSNLIIEVSEYDYGYTNQIMNNSISPLIDSLSPEFYTEYVVNEYDKNANGDSLKLKEYHPSNFPISTDDYLESEYYGNLRGYILDKIEKTMRTDPYLVASYYRWMENLDPKVITLSGTPKKVRFGTGKTGEFSGSNKVVTDTSIASVISDDIQYFTEPHSFITYYSSMDKCPSMVYINGKYVRPTCTRFYNGINYLFFPVSLINSEMSQFSTDVDIIAASPITIDMYPSAYNSLNDVPKDMFTINSMTDVIKIFNHLDDPKLSLEEIVLYDNSTGNFLGYLTDLFNVSLIVSEFRIDNPGITDRITIAHGETIRYLLTCLKEVYTTMDEEGIILGSVDVSLSWNTFVESLIKDGVITNNQKIDFMHKKLDFNDIEITPKDESLIGMTISLYSRNFKQEYILYTDDGMYDESNDKTVYTLNNFDLDPDLSRYFIFIDGKLITDEIIEVNYIYGGKMILSIPGDRTGEHKRIVAVHMPIRYSKKIGRLTDRVLYMKSADTTKTTVDEIWPTTTDDGGLIVTFPNAIDISYPLEDNKNLKFSDAGLRLPPPDKTTKSLYTMYYNDDRRKKSTIKDNAYDDINVFFISEDMPFTDIGSYNGIFNLYDTGEIPVNRLDVLYKSRLK